MSNGSPAQRPFRFWIAIRVGALLMPAAHTGTAVASELHAEATVLAGAQTMRAVAYDFRSVLLAGTHQTVPFSAERFAESNVVQVGLPMPPASLSAPVSDGAGAAGRTDSGAALTRAGGMTLLDRALMIVFGAGLIAYQLGRKQRVLRHTMLATGSL